MLITIGRKRLPATSLENALDPSWVGTSFSLNEVTLSVDTTIRDSRLEPMGSGRRSCNARLTMLCSCFSNKLQYCYTKWLV